MEAIGTCRTNHASIFRPVIQFPPHTHAHTNPRQVMTGKLSIDPSSAWPPTYCRLCIERSPNPNARSFARRSPFCSRAGKWGTDLHKCSSSSIKSGPHRDCATIRPRKPRSRRGLPASRVCGLPMNYTADGRAVRLICVLRFRVLESPLVRSSRLDDSFWKLRGNIESMCDWTCEELAALLLFLSVMPGRG